jgi:tripartite-type tricarboxylate transporter receptor subunit TctC
MTLPLQGSQRRARLALCWSVVAGLCVVALAAPASAQTDYPNKPITVIVPFAAGGPTDVIARAVAGPLSQRLGQPVNVVNQTQGGFTAVLAQAARAPADGYTLSVGHVGSHVVSTAVYRNLPYDPVTSFDPVGVLNLAPIVLVVRSESPIRNVKEFVATAKARKDSLKYGSAGLGSVSHYGCAMMLSAIGADVQHEKYRGAAPAQKDLLEGKIDFMCDQSQSVIPMVREGKLRALAVLAKRKLPQLPGVPAASEAGFKDLDLTAWNGMFAPKGTPQAVITKLNSALQDVFADERLRAQMRDLGVDLPTAESAPPGILSVFIALGQRRDVPVIRAKGEYLD